MRLALLKDTSTNYSIFCRGHDAGRSQQGASRDLDSQGQIDLYCRECTAKHGDKVILEATN